MKTCTKCGQTKPFSDFRPRGKSYFNHCKKCDYARKKKKISENPELAAQYHAAYRQKNKEKLKEYHREWRAKNKEKLIAKREAEQGEKREYNRAYHEANRDKILTRMRQYKILAKDKISQYRQAYKEREKLVRQKWARGNLPRLAEKAAKRRAMQKRAFPKWANVAAIREIYRQAATMQDVHVDHIVPLVSPLVCGLHVAANLQILPATENMSKSNRYWPDMP